VERRTLGEEHPETLSTAHNLAVLLLNLAKDAEAAEILLITLNARRRVLGKAHPDTLATAECLADTRSKFRAEQPTKRGGKAAARREERADASALSPTALVEAETKARVAEAELLAMLELEEATSAKGPAKGHAKGRKGGR
jgi:hypothetical protein